MKRKSFIRLIPPGVAAFMLSSWGGCKHMVAQKINFIRSGANAAVGHLLWQPVMADMEVKKEIKTGTVVIGAGISGLSTAHFLNKGGHENFLVVELDNKSGGNSKNGENKFSKYPYGAHYLPIPNNENHLLLDFLTEKKLITAFDETGQPVYDEFSLCQEPEERLLINNYWQEGIVPNTMLSAEDEKQIAKFFSLTEKLKKEKGKDKKFVFDIPVAEASRENDYIHLDTIPFADYLKQEGYTSAKLLWYLRYCCRDDYGQSFENVSAYAGLHYFASRRGTGSNCDTNSLLTWPEGNGKLVELLEENISAKIKTGQLVQSVEIKEAACETLVLDVNSKEYYKIVSKHVVMAVPYFVRKKILKQVPQIDFPEMVSQPWLVATVTVKGFADKNGFPLSWDNVSMEGSSLGFVFAQHQSLARVRENFVFTLYKPLDEMDAKNSRTKYYNRTNEELKREIIEEFSLIYPAIEKEMIEIDCHIHGHGMVSPGIGSLMNANRKLLSESINGKIFFAHTDYSGISIFEEAFWQGHRAAQEILNATNA